MTLERLEITPFSTIAGEIVQNRRSGTLTVLHSPIQRALYWAQGELVMALPGNSAESLPQHLISRGAVPPERAAAWLLQDPLSIVEHVHEAGLLDHGARQALLRDWLSGIFLPLFSLAEGTAAFTDEEPLPPERRIFVQSTASLIVEGVRSIANGLLVRQALGPLDRTIRLARKSRFTVESLPLDEQERKIASSLAEPATVESFLKRSGGPSINVAKLLIALTALGVVEEVKERETGSRPEADDTARDLALLAAIGANDQRSLQAAAFSRRLESLDHYQLLDIPRAATRSQLLAAAERKLRTYDPATYPPAVREATETICRRVREAAAVLGDPARRPAYDRLLQNRGGEAASSLQQQLARRTMAEQNYARAKQLSAAADYYGAIVLLKQAVNFLPDYAEAWHLLGSCQQRNPKWRREAAESFQRALAIDPENAEILISLGDLYRTEGMTSRAQTCYEDALKIQPENPQARSRLDALNRR